MRAKSCVISPNAGDDVRQQSRCERHCSASNYHATLCAGARMVMSWRTQSKHSAVYTACLCYVFFPFLSLKASVLNLIWLGLSQWWNNRSWKFTERKRCLKNESQKSRSNEEVLGKGEHGTWSPREKIQHGYTLLKSQKCLCVMPVS